MMTKFLTTASLSLLALSTLAAQQSDAKATKLLGDVEAALGGWDMLYAKGDVEYHYDYRYPGNGQADVSTERYIFEGEHSYGHYTQHDINVVPGASAKTVTQTYVDRQPGAMMDGQKATDEAAVGGAAFLRPTNYYWFTMFYKLNDPGSVAKYEGRETVDGTAYEKVHVSYDPAVTGKELNDEYILYIHPKTKRVDMFYFSLPVMGVTAPVILMKNNYETVDGVPVVTRRDIYQPQEDGTYPDAPQLVQTLTNVKFGNGFTKADLRG